MAWGRADPARLRPTAGADFLVPPSGPPLALLRSSAALLPTHEYTHKTRAQKTSCCQRLHSCLPRPRGQEQVCRCSRPELIARLGPGPSWWPHAHIRQIWGRLFVKSQLAACLGVPGSKGLGPIKQPLMRRYGELRPGRDFSAFFWMCVCSCCPTSIAKVNVWGLPCVPVSRIPCSQCRRPGFNPWTGN